MQIGMRGAAFIFVLGTVGHLQLQLERCQRRAQRVCRIGDERALVCQCGAESRQQIVQCIRQRADLVRQIVRGQRRQRSRIARLHLPRHGAQRRQPAPDRQPDDPA